MRFRWVVLAAVLIAAACSSVKPVPIAAGDRCFRCRRIIADTRLAGEIVVDGGRAFKFRTPGCMAKYVKANPDVVVKGTFLTDYATGRMVKANAVTLVPTMIGEGAERALDYVAYSYTASANEAATREKTSPTTWKALLEQTVVN
jgi:hypothetical protein